MSCKCHKGICACCKFPIYKPDVESPDLCEECFESCKDTPCCVQVVKLKTKKPKRKSK